MDFPAELEAIVTSIHHSIRRGGSESRWLIKGRLGTGKSAALCELSRKLKERNLYPVRVAPPKQSFDTGPSALLQLETGLARQKLLNGELDHLAAIPDDLHFLRSPVWS